MTFVSFTYRTLLHNIYTAYFTLHATYHITPCLPHIQGKKIDGPSEEMKKETKIFENMTREQEWDHWTKKFNHYFEDNEDRNPAAELKFDPEIKVSDILKKIDDEDEKKEK